jgi:hypothetical protein
MAAQTMASHSHRSLLGNSLSMPPKGINAVFMHQLGLAGRAQSLPHDKRHYFL